jgi:hypothetical protein
MATILPRPFGCLADDCRDLELIADGYEDQLEKLVE